MKYFKIFLLELMATNFSPSSGSYVLNKFPSISQWSDTGPSWPSCFLNACRYWPDFLACKSITTTHRLSLSFVTLYWFFVKLRALDLVNLIDQTVFRTFFPKSLQILSWIFACKSIIITYRSSWSFIAPHWIFVKLRILHLVNFTDGTVFQTFFYTLADIVLIFGM